MAQQKIYTSAVFQTGNRMVRKAPVGSLFVKSAEGELSMLREVEEDALPFEESFEVGERVLTPHGAGTVVRLSTRFAPSAVKSLTRPDGVLYVTDDDAVVRLAPRHEVELL